MITIKHLSKTYTNPGRQPFTVLRDVNAEIQKGEVISIIGPSGTGKSTFLRALNLLDPPTGGEILLDGENILAKGYPLPRMRQRMGMVFQSFNLFEHLTILENVTLAPIKLLKKSKAEAEEEAMSLLRKVGMAEKAHVLPSSLSGGQKQRVAIARCLAMHPEIILFDEPTSALDPTMVGEVLSVIRQLATEGMTMLIVTHEMKFARDVSTRIFFMNDGIIYEDGTPEQIFDHPQKPVTQAFIRRIRSLAFQIGGPDFDLYGMMTEVRKFCIKYGLVNKIDIINHLLEELLHELIPVSCRPVSIDVSYSEQTYALQLSMVIGGVTSSPLLAPQADPLAVGIVRGMSQSIDEQPTPEGWKMVMEI